MDDDYDDDPGAQPSAGPEVQRRRDDEIDDARVESDDFPAKLMPLFGLGKWRYKIVPGGRGGGRSWGAVRAALRLAKAERLRIVFLREVQRSLEESVFQLMLDQIARMGLGDFFSVTKNRITGLNGSFFSFRGLSNITAASLKSLEGYDIAVVEEAQTVTAKSWKLLIPTIRNKDSEIWVLLNPELDTDPTYKLFIESPPPDSITLWMNWRDNPWFPPVLQKERVSAQARLSADEYNNIWEGRARSAVVGAIFADEIAQAFKERRICDVPYDPRFRAHVVLDLGWNDQLFAAVVQRHLSSLRVVEAWGVDHKTLDWVSARLRDTRRNWGYLFLPHDGAHGDFKTGKSTRQLMEEKGWSVRMVPNVPVETGIKRAREALPGAYFDRRRAAPLVQALQRYKRVDLPKAENFGRPLHDIASHGGDCFRYVSLAMPAMDNYADEDALMASLQAHSADYQPDAYTGM